MFLFTRIWLWLRIYAAELWTAYFQDPATLLDMEEKKCNMSQTPEEGSVKRLKTDIIDLSSQEDLSHNLLEVFLFTRGLVTFPVFLCLF